MYVVYCVGGADQVVEMDTIILDLQEKGGRPKTENSNRAVNSWPSPETKGCIGAARQ